MPSLEFGLCDLRVNVEIFLHADEKFAANPRKLRPHQSSFGVGGAFYTSRSGGLTGHAVRQHDNVPGCGDEVRRLRTELAELSAVVSELRVALAAERGKVLDLPSLPARGHGLN